MLYELFGNLRISRSTGDLSNFDIPFTVCVGTRESQSQGCGIRISRAHVNVDWNHKQVLIYLNFVKYLETLTVLACEITT